MNVTIAGRDGRAYGILGVCSSQKRRFSAQDTVFLAAVANLLTGAIQRRQLEQRHELMIRDMRHRTGNLFSQLLALFSQTARTSKSIPDLTSKYQARVLAMANAHRLITEGGWQSIPIMELLHVVLGPYLDRASLSGPNVDLEPDPVFNLSAALHELAANAIKHGSLSRPKGQLDLHWSVERTARGMTLMLDWVEKNGPPARRPRKTGFGTRLIDLVIERQLNGEVIRTYSSTGLTVKMLVPLTHERWPTPTPAPGDSPGETQRRHTLAARGASAVGLGAAQQEPAREASEEPALSQGRTPFERIALLLQGGGALGSYQAGVYEALAEADLQPDWVAGISIGAINSAIIAGNPPEKRVARLREFWETVSTSPLGIPYFKHVELKDEVNHQFVNQARAMGVLSVRGAELFRAPHAAGDAVAAAAAPTRRAIMTIRR